MILSVSENILNMLLDLVWTWGYYLALFLLPIMLYCLVRTRTKSRYSNRDWFYGIKYFYAKKAVKKFQDKCARTAKEIAREDLEKVKKIRSDKYRDNHYIYGLDQNGNSLSLKITIRANLVAEVYLVLRLADGATYTLPDKARLCSISKWQWQAGGVRIDVLEPLKRLRITHNGMLLRSIPTTTTNAISDTNIDEINEMKGQLHHVQFNFIFNSTGLPTFYPQDASTKSLADSIASETWRDGHWLNLLGDERGYEQFGALYGSVRGEAFTEDLILNLPSCRTRFWGTNENQSLNRSVRLFLVASDGTGINVWIKSLKKGCQLINHGNVLFSDGNMTTIDDCDFRLRFVAQHHSSIPSIFTVNIKANNKDFRCVFHVKDSLTTVSSETKGHQVIESRAECDLNSIQGRATVEFWYSRDGPGCELPAPLISSCLNKQKHDVESQADAYLIDFKDERAKYSSLTGGKGSSLALLTSIQSQEFKVPEGFIVTTKSFKEHCEKSFNLKKALSILVDLCHGKTDGDLKAACEETAKLFRTEKMSETLAEQIIKSTSDTKKYAVRSSGVSEDTEELSAAGQNETFLGVSREHILESVAKCWASLFSYQSVKYRHQHGLPIKSQMAVVIQEMVASQVAGVLFTCHPSSGNPSEILITANYGLGESVVSGKSEPDTIIVDRYTLSILSNTLGSKQISVQMSQNGTEEITADEGKEICVSDSQCTALAQVGIAIEAAFGDARDIEWAFTDGQLYLLQSRPITTLQSWTDSELLHEFDTPTFTDDVVFTVANTGEVFPGSQSTLTLSSVCQIIDTSIQTTVLDKPDPSAMKCLSIFQNHVFIDVVNGMHRNPQEKIQMTAKLLDLSIFGHPVINERINNIGIQRFGIRTQREMHTETWRMVKNAWFNQKHVAAITKGARDLDDEINSKDTTVEMYEKIDRLMVRMVDVFKYHVPISSSSVFYQMVEMNILVGSSEEITAEHYNDIALILSSNDDVISAEIPTTLERIAKALQRKRTEFLQVDPKDGVAWLKANCLEASEILDKFLNDHGHRVLGEFDIYKNTWGSDPSQIIKMIQINCTGASTTNATTKQEKPEIDAIIAELKSPKNNFTRKILKFLLKKSRKAVGARELSKCEAVRTIHKLRLAYRKLAAKMAEEGLIPTADLIFHLSHYEIKEIVVEKSKKTPQLIQKAWRRQRLHPTWNKLKFPEVSYGLPRAEDDGDYQVGCGSDVKLEGTPVCSGTVKARACVITGLDEIDQLQNGDVLITYCTDIGWSPYFPMLAGIVTELGGLISHGAVVAREYGLPSIVGVKSATRVFKTGDTVLLSGKTGTIELVV